MKYNIYDFDGTIYDGDSGIDIVIFAMKKYPKIILKILGSIILYTLRIIDKKEFKSRVFSFVKYIDDLDKFVDEFWLHHEKKLKKFWIEQPKHKNEVIISASCRFWLEWIVKKYKVTGLIATEIDNKTGEIVGNNCHGEEKVIRFYQDYPKGIIAKMYTDSINDLPLIEEAEEGILVKKNKLYNYYEYKPNIFIRFWRFCWSIYHKNEEVWNYLIVGGLTTLISILSKQGLSLILDVDKAIQLQIIVILSWIISVAFAYITNKIYVFKSKNKNVIKELLSFVGARLVTLGMEMLIMWFFVTILKMNFTLWTILSQLLIIVFNYLFSKLFVFKK